MRSTAHRSSSEGCGGSCANTSKEGPAPALDVKLLDGPARELRCRTHETISKVSDDVGRRYKFNTACAACRELVNDIMAFDADTDARRSVVREALESIVLMLAPVVPHVCHTLWRALGHREPIIDAPWPEADEAAMSRDVIELVVQVNGKLRGHVSVGADADREAVEREAQRNDNVARFIGEKPIRKVIVVPGPARQHRRVRGEGPLTTTPSNGTSADPARPHSRG